MARYTGPVDRLSRREGRDLKLKGERYYKGKDPLKKRAFPPGVHVGTRGKQSTYLLQLREKQACKRIYGILEKQFRRYYQKANRFRGVTGHILMQLLEQRLDNVVYRAGFASTRASARQMVVHGHVRVNGKKVDRPSYEVKPGDEISLKAKAKESKVVLESIELLNKQGGPRSWVEVNEGDKVAKFVRIPDREEINDIEVNEQLIVELYSK